MSRQGANTGAGEEGEGRLFREATEATDDRGGTDDTDGTGDMKGMAATFGSVLRGDAPEASKGRTREGGSFTRRRAPAAGAPDPTSGRPGS
ncbi:hypothetical protein GCM10010344_45020 [Streptomyces bluensis]|nr:hypothetical protein GCM10010344_45020 [Streptomyces bluensis]